MKETTGHAEYGPVNHPSHYNQHPAGIECIDVIEHFSLNVGNAVKYVWRAGLKPSAAHDQDLAKAIWYLERERARLRKDAERGLAEQQAGIARAHAATIHHPGSSEHGVERELRRATPTDFLEEPEAARPESTADLGEAGGSVPRAPRAVRPRGKNRRR